MEYNPEIVGKKIRKERLARSLSQSKLGETIGVSGKQISNYENGKLLPPQDILLKMAGFFQCEYGYLLGEESYQSGTKLNTAICESLGLSIAAVDALRKVTHTGLKVEVDDRQKAISKFFESSHFSMFVECLFDAYSASYAIEQSSNSAYSNLVDLYGEEIVQKATLLLLLPNKLIDSGSEVQRAYSALNENIDKQQNKEYTLKIARYELRESFERLVDDFLHVTL